MDVTLSPIPICTTQGSADDRDPATPPDSWGPNALVTRTATDANTSTTVDYKSGKRLQIIATAQTANGSVGMASASGKATTAVKLTVKYTFVERALFSFFGIRQQFNVQPTVKVQTTVNTGTALASYAVRIINGPNGEAPLPGRSGSITIRRNVADATKLDITRIQGNTVQHENDGSEWENWTDYPVKAAPGIYDLLFEVNGATTADGTVLMDYEGSVDIQF